MSRITISTLDSMLEPNRDFAARESAAGKLMPSLPRALPNVKAIIIGCADMRVDPAHVLGIKPGEAVVMRNIGGRITPGLLEQLGLLGRIGEVAGEIPGGGEEFHIIVLQHTACGITRLAGHPAMLTRYFEVEEGQQSWQSGANRFVLSDVPKSGCGRISRLLGAAARAAAGVDTVFYTVGVPYPQFEQHPKLTRVALGAAAAAGVRLRTFSGDLRSDEEVSRARIAINRDEEESTATSFAAVHQINCDESLSNRAFGLDGMLGM